MAQGLDYYERRLRRAQAVPVEERSPEVAAFVEADALLREAAQLLPVHQRTGKPELAVGPVARRQLLLALAKMARANYLGPHPAVDACGAQSHLMAYLLGSTHTDALNSAWSKKGSPYLKSNSLDETLLGGALQQLVVAQSASTLYLQWRMACGAFKILAEPTSQQSCRRALAQMASSQPQPQPQPQQQRLPSVEQLLHQCCCQLLASGPLIVNNQPGNQYHVPQFAERVGGPQLSSAELAAMEAMVARAGSLAMDIEPENPKTYYNVAPSLNSASEAAGLHLRAYQLARQQGSNWFIAMEAAAALLSSTDSPLYVGQETAEAALAAFEHAEPALRRCQRLLPVYWIQGLEVAMQSAGQRVPRALAQLESMRQMNSSSGSGSGDAALRLLQQHSEAQLAGLHKCEEHVQTTMHMNRCDGCGERALGLRRCARCKVAQYCSRECQVRAWPTHKQECNKQG